jgi:hypothetical protein
VGGGRWKVSKCLVTLIGGKTEALCFYRGIFIFKEEFSCFTYLWVYSKCPLIVLEKHGKMV